MSEFIRTLSGSGWAPISRKAADDTRLSIAARGVLAWLCTRPDDHKIMLAWAMQRWGISKPTWRKIRIELENAGYLKQIRRREVGRFVWVYQLTDTPADASTMVKKTTDSISTGRNTIGRKSRHIQETAKRETSSPETSPPSPPTPSPRVSSRETVRDI